MRDKISTVIERVYEIINNRRCNREYSHLWKRTIINTTGFDWLINKCPPLTLTSALPLPFLFPSTLLMGLDAWGRDFFPTLAKLSDKMHLNAHQRGVRWQTGWLSMQERCGIWLWVNIKLFIEFIFSVANDSSCGWKTERECRLIRWWER